MPSSSMAWLRNPSNPVLQATFNSFEIAAAFVDYYHPVLSPDTSYDPTASSQDEGDTEEAE